MFVTLTKSQKANILYMNCAVFFSHYRLFYKSGLANLFSHDFYLQGNRLLCKLESFPLRFVLLGMFQILRFIQGKYTFLSVIYMVPLLPR